MPIVEFARWKLDCDPESTRAAFVRRLKGSPEECGCIHCRNFIAVRKEAYPPEAIALFEKLGIQPDREAEIYHITLLPSGLHLYGGFIHLAGTLLSGADAKERVEQSVRTFDLERLTERFSLGFTRDIQLIPEPFTGLELVQLEFTTEIPWVMEEQYMD